MSDSDVLKALRDAINDGGYLDGVSSGLTAVLDYLASTPPAASVQQLPGAKWLTQYVDGTGTRQQPFAVLVRTAAGDTAVRLAATDALRGIDAIEGVTMESSPALVGRGTDGSEEWRASYMLEWQE